MSDKNLNVSINVSGNEGNEQEAKKLLDTVKQLSSFQKEQLTLIRDEASAHEAAYKKKSRVLQQEKAETAEVAKERADQISEIDKAMKEYISGFGLEKSGAMGSAEALGKLSEAQAQVTAGYQEYQQLLAKNDGSEEFHEAVAMSQVALSNLVEDVNTAADEYEKAVAREEAADGRLLNSVITVSEALGQMTSGATSVARSFVLMGIASEENAQKMIQTIAQFEAVAQGLRGVIEIGQAAIRMYRGLQAARAAAAAGTAIQGVAAGAAKGAAGGAAGGVVAGAAGGAAGAGGAAAVGGGLTLAGVGVAAKGVATTLGAWIAGAVTSTAAMAVGALGAGIAVGGALGHFTGFHGDNGGRGGSDYTGAIGARRSAKRMQKEQDERDKEFLSDHGQVASMYQRNQAQVNLSNQMGIISAGKGLSGTDREMAILMERADQSAETLGAKKFGGGHETPAQMQARIKAGNDLMTLNREISNLQVRIKKDEIDEKRTSLALSQQKLAVVKEERSLMESNVDRLANMTAGEAAQAKKAVQSAQDGSLTFKEAKALEPLGLFKDLVDNAKLEQAKKRGLADIFGPDFEAVLKDLKKQEAAETKISTDYKIEIEADDTNLKKLIEQLEKDDGVKNDKIAEQIALYEQLYANINQRLADLEVKFKDK